MPKFKILSGWCLLFIVQNCYAQDVELGPIKVVAPNSADANYTVPTTDAVTGINLDLQHTPQSLSFVTEKQIQDQQLRSVADVAAQLPGVTTTKWGQNIGGYSSIKVRGFSVNNAVIDGTPSIIGHRTTLEGANASIYESVGMLRGASGLMGNVGDAGGSLILQRKRPTLQPLTNLQARLGSWNTIGAQVDLSRSLNASETLRGRLVIDAERGKTWQERVGNKSALIYSMVEYLPSANLSLYGGFKADYSRANNATPHGFERVDKTGTKATPFGRRDNAATNWSYGTVNNNELFIGADYAWNQNWLTKVSYTLAGSRTYRHLGVAGSSYIDLINNEMSLASRVMDNKTNSHSLDIINTGSYALFGRQHELSLGLNLYQAQEDSNFVHVSGKLPVTNWHGAVPMPDFSNTKLTTTKTTQANALVATKLNATDKFSLLLGSNFIHYVNKEQSENEAATELKTTLRAVPYVALMYDIVPNLTAYASYTSIFKPQSKRDINDQTLAPVTGNTYELGLKGSSANNVYNYWTAIFSTRQNNYARALLDANGKNVPIPNRPDEDAYYADKGVSVRGMDLGISGEVLPNWLLSAGYTYTVTKDKDKQRIQAFEPKHQLKLFSTYQLNQWTLGGGVNLQSQTYDEDATGLAKEVTSQKSFALVELMAGYQINSQAKLALNIKNLFDKLYWLNSAGSTYGAPRQVSLTFNYQF